MYGTVHGWQQNEITFLIAEKGVGWFLSEVVSLSSFLSLAQKLESKRNGKTSKFSPSFFFSLKNYTYKCICMCVCIHTEGKSVLLRAVPLVRGKAVFLTCEAWQYGIICIAVTLPLWCLHLSFIRSRSSCSLHPGLCYLVPKDPEKSLLSSKLAPNPQWTNGDSRSERDLAFICKLNNSLLLSCFSSEEFEPLALFPTFCVAHNRKKL